MTKRVYSFNFELFKVTGVQKVLLSFTFHKAKPVMEYIKSIPMGEQKEIIKKHNLKIINEYSEIMRTIENVLESKDSVKINVCGGGKII